MSISENVGIWFWGFLILYGAAMYLLSPAARDHGGFFRGTDAQGRAASQWSLTASIFISWIFAKSVTNAADLGAQYGIVGGLAYAAYWLSIPLAGWVIYRLRTRHGATGLVPFLVGKYGRAAALAFSAAILIRLYNEVWSNTAVVGGYYGAAGSFEFIAAALLFTAVTLFYSIKGGLRSSIYTDVIQTGIFALFVGLGAGVGDPRSRPEIAARHRRIPHECRRGPAAGGAAAGAVLPLPRSGADRPRLHHRGEDHAARLRRLRRAGLRLHPAVQPGGRPRQAGRPALSDNVPAAVAKGLGSPLFFMTVVMVASAGSTLDSTFSSVAKSVAQELPLLAGRPASVAAVSVGSFAMIAFAVLGNLPMIAGTDILKATTVSGTMVIGLAPVFLLARWIGYSPLSFHLSFWTGIVLGILLTLGLIPPSWAIGDGKYALLLGTNLYGLMLCTAGFLLPVLVTRRSVPTGWRAASATRTWTSSPPATPACRPAAASRSTAGAAP